MLPKKQKKISTRVFKHYARDVHTYKNYEEEEEMFNSSLCKHKKVKKNAYLL